MPTCNKNAVGLAVGSFVALIHAVWMILVGIGWAKPLTDWILSLHHLSFSYEITTFRFWTAILLIVFTFVGGYIFGWIFAALLNLFKK